MNVISCGASHNIVFSWARETGCSGQRQRCEDVVFLRKTRDFLFCGLADGQSRAEYGPEGGMACLKAVFEYICSRSIASLIHAPFPDELPCMIVRSFRRRLLRMARRRGKNINTFSSTLLAIAVDLKTGEYLLIHLGDGCALGIPESGEGVLISAPDNGLTQYHTWLTTSDNAVAHLRVRFGSLKTSRRIVLASDGAVCFCRGGSIPRRTSELLKEGTQPQLHRLLQESHPQDDATCIILDLQENTVSREVSSFPIAEDGKSAPSAFRP